jgi:hypothetical protein
MLLDVGGIGSRRRTKYLPKVSLDYPLINWVMYLSYGKLSANV